MKESFCPSVQYPLRNIIYIFLFSWLSNKGGCQALTLSSAWLGKERSVEVIEDNQF